MTRSPFVFGIVFGLICRIALSGRRGIRALLLLLVVFAAPCRADSIPHACPTLWARVDLRSIGTVAGSVAAGEPPFFRPEHLAPVAADTASAGTGRVRGAEADKVVVLALVALLELPFRLLRGLRRRLRSGHRARDTARRRRALAVADTEIEAQRSRLRVRRLQLVVPDQYGTHDLGRWNREKAYFCRSRILRSLAARGLAGLWPDIAREVDRRIERVAVSPAAGRCRARGRLRAGEAFSRFDPRMDPTDYERHCAVLLRKAGWDAEVTVATGDQGTDVLARRGRRSLVLQCKLYSKPVGNSAVQQIAAARAHHRADFAAVVSNADFTRRARELAATNGVYLLHHDELADFPPAR